MRVAVFPGSFDPLTKGHEEIIRKAVPLFDKIYVAIGENANKKTCFPLEQRQQWIKQVFADEPHIEVAVYHGLTIDFCRKVKARYVIRGLRNPMDFQYEKDIAEANRHLAPEVETIFLLSTPELAHVSSSLVRELYRHQGNYSEYVSFDLK
ncbi:MAG: pantetheine-phosphate adenylyltransferase [Bacteroidales bacterium]|nr:pantetheine-phosphate adenylyltransferase [Bacteroidales bacterium]